jgi:ribonucleoside-triphosphate reductase
MAKCGAKTEIYSRVCGYFRPISNWNKGKKSEFNDRKSYTVPETVIAPPSGKKA